MAKNKSQRGLGTKGWIDRAVEKYGSVKAVAEKLGRSPSTISEIRSGKRPGTALRDAARDLAQGKRAPVAAPPSKGKREKTTAGQKLLRKAERDLLKADKKGKDRVVIYINGKQGATLGAHSGIAVHQILNAPSIEEFFNVQAGRQKYGAIDWDIIESIVFEEYY